MQAQGSAIFGKRVRVCTTSVRSPTFPPPRHRLRQPHLRLGEMVERGKIS